MKILYIEARNKKIPDSDYFIDPNFIRTLPKDVFLTYSIQFKGQAEAMKRALEAHNINVRGFQQVLGCTKLKTDYPIILIGQGTFHALNLAVQNRHPILLYSNGSSIAVGQKEKQELEKKKLGALNKFYASEKLGILVSSKPGQNRLAEAVRLKKIIKKKFMKKKVYIFISNSINLAEFENFDIDFFINTACPGLFNDSSRMINIDDIMPVFHHG